MTSQLNIRAPVETMILSVATLVAGFQRDFIGYGSRPPKVEWPQGKRLALQIVVNYEAGGERSIAHGDDGSETYGEFVSYGPPPKRDMAMESLFEYETRVAIWRRLELFDRHCVKVTFFATAKTLETNPEAAKAHC